MITTIQKCLLSLFLVLFLSSTIIAAPIDLPKDANGWTVFTPSTETDVVYVDPTTGNDSTCDSYRISDNAWQVSGHPTEPDSGEIIPCETYAAAYAKTGEGDPDWILIKRGETIIGNIGSSVRSGKDLDEPFLIGAYGTTGLSPMFKTGVGSRGISFAGSGRQWIAVSGLSFYSYTRNPGDPGYVGGTSALGINFQVNSGYTNQGILLEGCKFRFYSNNSSIGAGTKIDYVLRRCIIYDNYGGQGLYTHSTELTLEECIFDHNGWYDEYGGPIAPANTYDHNTYFENANNTTLQGNIFINPSCYNNKWTCSYGPGDSANNVVDNNLYIGGRASISFGTNYPDTDLRFKDTVITNNVITRPMYTKHYGTMAIGMLIAGHENVTVTGNIIFDQRDSDMSGGYAYAIKLSDRNIDSTISDNIIYNFQYGDGIRVYGREPWDNGRDDTYWVKSNVTINDNIIQIPSNASYLFKNESLSEMAGVTFNGNINYSNRSENDRFQVATTGYSIDGWNALTQVGTDTWEQYSFPDPSRTIETYMTSIGETNTIDAFITACRAQDRYDWDDNIMADPVNDYIRTGFIEMENQPPPISPPNPPSNLRVIE